MSTSLHQAIQRAHASTSEHAIKDIESCKIYVDELQKMSEDGVLAASIYLGIYQHNKQVFIKMCRDARFASITNDL